MGSLNPRERIIVVAAISVILLRSLYNLALIPYLKKLTSLDQEILNTENKLNKNRRLLSRKADMEKTFQDFSPEADKGKDSAGKQQVTRILIEIEQLAGKSNVQINDIKPLPLKNNEYFDELIVQLRLESGLKEIADFLYQVRESPEILTVENLQLNVKSSDSNLLDGYLEIHKLLL